MMKEKKYILFDLDGTVTNSKEGITKGVQYALKHFDMEVTDLDDLCKFIGPPLRQSFQKYYKLTKVESEKAVTVYREYYNDIGIYENQVYEGITDLLKDLKQCGKQVILSTCKPRVYAHRILEHFQLDSYFDFVCGSEWDGTLSHKWEVIQRVIQERKIANLSEAVMIGDREDDIIGAIKNHMDSIGVLYGFGSKLELQEAGGIITAENTADLRKLLLD